VTLAQRVNSEPLEASITQIERTYSRYIPEQEEYADRLDYFGQAFGEAQTEATFTLSRRREDRARARTQTAAEASLPAPS